VKPFLDTNILVYAALSDDPRRPTAERLLAAGGAISVQVLNEFANVARGKLKWPWPDIEAMLALVRGRSAQVRDISVSTHEGALALARDHGLSIYDALIVVSAIEAGCDTLYTEDMQHGRTIGELAIVNPFLERAP
jgi:predicted nucleic acid-binding protein